MVVQNPTDTADAGGDTASSYGGYFAAASFASDLLGAFYGASQYRSELKIRKEEQAINKLLADSQFNQNMQALFSANQDLKDKTTQELELGRKEFKSRQAQMAVLASERGAEGQSVTDVHNDLTRTHEAFTQLQLINLGKGERDLQRQRMGIIDQRTAQTLGNAISDPSTPTPFLSALSAAPMAGIQAMLDYKYYKGESGVRLPAFITRGNK